MSTIRLNGARRAPYQLDGREACWCSLSTIRGLDGAWRGLDYRNYYYHYYYKNGARRAPYLFRERPLV